MYDDEIFAVLEKCKGDLEYDTIESALQGVVQFQNTYHIVNHHLRNEPMKGQRMI